jgi:hypothetical protein
LTVPLLAELLHTIIFDLIPNQLCDVFTCKCGKTLLHIYWFFSVCRVCIFCGSSTSQPFYGSTITHKIFNSKQGKYNSNQNFSFFELVDVSYRPGFCTCGRTNTEIPWNYTLFCGYCGTEITTNSLIRRHQLGYLPLSVPIAHVWYFNYEPRPLIRLSGFTRRLFPLILRCERVAAEEAYFTIQLNTRIYFSCEFQSLTNYVSTGKINIISMGKSPVLEPWYINRIVQHSNRSSNLSKIWNQRTIEIREIKVFFLSMVLFVSRHTFCSYFERWSS